MKRNNVVFICFVLAFLLFSCKTLKLHDSSNSKKYKIFFIGDSMSSDDPNNINLNRPSTTESYGWKMKKILNDSIKYIFRNYAVSGVGFPQMQQQMKNIMLEYDSTRINIVFILGCINNISFNEMDGEDCYSNMRSIHEALCSHGFKTVGISLTSRRQLSVLTEAQCQKIWLRVQAANALFLAHWSEFTDVWIDLQSEKKYIKNEIVKGFGGYSTATESTYFLPDGCHYSDAGKMQLANHYAIPAIKLIGLGSKGIISY